jgi:hypothetical protein
MYTLRKDLRSVLRHATPGKRLHCPFSHVPPQGDSSPEMVLFLR